MLAVGCSDAPVEPEFFSNCTVGAASAEATKTAGRQADGSAILPGGRKLTPAGKLLEVGGYPISLRLLPGDRYVVVSDDYVDDQALRIVDLEATDPQKAVVSQKDYPIGQGGRGAAGLFYGLALSSDGKKLFASNGGYDPIPKGGPNSTHYNTIDVFDISGNPPVLTRIDANQLHLTWSDIGQRIPSGLLLSADQKLLYVAAQGDNTLAIVSVDPGPTYGIELGRAQLPGIGAYDVAVDESSHTAFVSLWGGSGSTDGIVAVDVANPMAPIAQQSPIPTGKAAEAELLVAGKLYVSNADADTVSIVDAATRAVKTMPATSSMILGATPNSIAIEPAGAAGAGRIYLANAGENAVVALDLDSLKILGRIPTAWYPTAVAVRGDGALVIASARGTGRGPRDGSPEPPFAAGTLQLVPRPSDAELTSGDATAGANLDRPRTVAPTPVCTPGEPARFPLPVNTGDPSPIKYAFLIVRENKTYDGLFGDIAEGNGKVSLTVFGENETPNAHALARGFVLVDNFYSHAELSLQGHMWTTGCIANDYTEKAWSNTDDYGRAYRQPIAFGPPNGLSRLTIPGSGSIFHHLDKLGIAYHNYGEVVGADAMKLADGEFPGVYFNTDISDVYKAEYILSVVTDPKVTVEPFSYILLPNDHSHGTLPGAPTPVTLVADNDEGTGRFIDGLSHSPLWKQSIVFVLEDDPGGTPDHVEEHRSILLVASPWVKRGYRASTNYDIGSVYATIEHILGIPPMNLNDGHASPMYEMFTTTPDTTPYTVIPHRIKPATNPLDAPLAEESKRIDWSRPDTADLTRILWKSVKGAKSEPPGWPYKRKFFADYDRDGDD